VAGAAGAAVVVAAGVLGWSCGFIAGNNNTSLMLMLSDINMQSLLQI